MQATLTQPFAPELRHIANEAVAGLLAPNFLGLRTGFRAFRINNTLSEMSDLELSRLELKRQDIPRVAFELARLED
jgi:hypothetical protein